MQTSMNLAVGDPGSFTEAEYRALIKAAKLHWNFIGYGDYARDGASILWRHDIDYSVHRAKALAEIEEAEGVSSTFFVLLHSPFYNLLEKEICRLVHEVVEMGHNLGLHFDPQFYEPSVSDNELIDKMAFEREILERIFHCTVSAFSWHNPSLATCASFRNLELAGMINAYSTEISSKFSYISDSNGLWRERTLTEVLEQPTDRYLHVLTHPEWWTVEVLPPRDKIVRAAEGRKEAVLSNYDSFLAQHRRPNIGITVPAGTS